MRQRIVFGGLFLTLSVAAWLASAEVGRAQDRGGAAQPPVQPPPGANMPPPGPGMPPPAGGGGGGGVIPPGLVPPGMVPPGGGVVGGGGGVLPPMAGNIGIGAIPVTPPPPIGYYAPTRAVDWNIGKFFYYPYYNFPHSYWPTETCAWPERPGEPYQRPPAYMSYPPFLEPHWRYEWYTPQKYYRGFHFWLDQF